VSRIRQKSIKFCFTPILNFRKSSFGVLYIVLGVVISTQEQVLYIDDAHFPLRRVWSLVRCLPSKLPLETLMLTLEAVMLTLETLMLTLEPNYGSRGTFQIDTKSLHCSRIRVFSYIISQSSSNVSLRGSRVSHHGSRVSLHFSRVSFLSLHASRVSLLCFNCASTAP
jgi:hypothetical protein